MDKTVTIIILLALKNNINLEKANNIITNNLGKLNLEFNDEAESVIYCNYNVSEEFQNTLDKELEECNVKPMFIIGNDNILEAKSTNNGIDLLK